eukprot:3328638-Amphidinium_carterae.1
MVMFLLTHTEVAPTHWDELLPQRESAASNILNALYYQRHCADPIKGREVCLGMLERELGPPTGDMQRHFSTWVQHKETTDWIY